MWHSRKPTTGLTLATGQGEAPARRPVHAAGRAYGQWLGQAPDTRGLATALAALYPVGGLYDVLAGDPLVGLFAVPAAAATWVGTYKRHGSRSYSAAVTAGVAGVPVWLATATATGAWNLPTLLGYSTTAAGLWSAVTWSDLLRSRRDRKAAALAWSTMVASVPGLKWSRLLDVSATALGERYHVDVRATMGRVGTKVATATLAEEIAGIAGLGKSQVSAWPDPKHAGLIFIEIQRTDPTTIIPDVPATGARSGGRSIMDRPFRVGTNLSTGGPLEITLFGKGGGRHTMVVATTGGGKTTLYSNINAEATDCDDVLVWAIDTGKGTIPTLWRDALDAEAGIGEHDRAVQILQWAVTVIDMRSAATGGQDHEPSPTAPVIVLEIDEMDTLIGWDAPAKTRRDAKRLLDYIDRRGRSAGVVNLKAGQRGSAQHTGDKEPHANSANKAILRVASTGEMAHVIPDWFTLGMPDMTSYGQETPGVVLIADPNKKWQAGRIAHLDHKLAAPFAQRRGAPTARLEPAIAAALEGYGERRRTPVTVSLGRTDDPGATAVAERARTETRRMELTEDYVADQFASLSQDLARMAADMPTPPAKEDEVPLRDLGEIRAALDEAKHTGGPAKVPDRIARPVLGLLQDRGPDGASTGALAQVADIGVSTMRRWLGLLREAGQVRTVENGPATRHYLNAE